MANPGKAIESLGSMQSKEEDGSMSGHQIPEFVASVRSSTAGAGSGEFHVYKQTKRKNIVRQEEEENAIRAQKEAEDFENRRREAQIRDDQKTERNRQKRRKRNGKTKKKGQSQNSLESETNDDLTKEAPHDIPDPQNVQGDMATERAQDTQTPESPSHGIKIVEDAF